MVALSRATYTSIEFFWSMPVRELDEWVESVKRAIKREEG